MAIFYGILLPKLLDKKYLYYIFCVLAISTIHKSSVLYFIIPVILFVNQRIWKLAIAGSLVLGIGMALEPVQMMIAKLAVFMGASSGYFGTVKVSWVSLAERLLMLALILILWVQNKEHLEIRCKATSLLKIYVTSVLIYVALCSNSFVSSRLAIMFKMAEIVLIPILLEGVSGKLRKAMGVFLLGTMTVMMYKNLNFYSETYYEGISGYNLPYVTIFNQKDILNYRPEYVNENYNFEEHEYLKDWL